MEGRTSTVADVYAAAIAESSDEAYDQLVRIAGVDWLNAEFLAGANGFPATVIQRSYTGDGVDVSPAMTIAEGSRRATVPARRATARTPVLTTGTARTCSRYLLAVATPEDGPLCPGLVTIAGATLQFLESTAA